MKIKSLIALTLVLVMIITVFAACGNKEKTPDNSASPKVSDGGSTPDDGEEEELREISLWLADMGNGGLNQKGPDVEEAINKIMMEEYNIKVNFTWQNMADIGTQFTLSISNKEQIDIILTTPAPAGSFTTYYSSGMLADIADLVDEYGQGLKELMDPLNLIGAYTMPDGGVYGLPAYRILNSNLYLIMRNDILEASGVLEDAKNMSSWSDYEKVLHAMTAEGSQYGTAGSMGDGMSIGGFVFGTGDFKDVISYDPMSDGTGVVYSDQSGNVSLLYENPGMVAQYKMMADWYNKGYIYPDSVFANEQSGKYLTTGTVGSIIKASEYGVEPMYTGMVGSPVTCIEVAANMLSTGSCTKFGVAVPVTSKEPEAAMIFLNALYTRADLMNLIAWGIEGETYEIKDSGEAGYIGDADATTSGYHGSDFLIGNQFLVLPWQGNGADFRDKALESLMSAPVSAYMGLTIDTSEMDTIISAISSVRAEFHPQIAGGMYTDEVYDEFLKKLDSAQIDEYIALYQDAVNEFTK